MNRDGLIKAARVLARIADVYKFDDQYDPSISLLSRVGVLTVGDCLDAREALRSETKDARRAFEAALRKGNS